MVVFGLSIVIITMIVMFYGNKFIHYLMYRKEPRMKHNFPFKFHGKTYWWSRACAVALFTFCKDKDGNFYVLANQRGRGTPDFQGYWNCCCGYLDTNETAKEAARRETLEETGVNIPLDKIKLVDVNTSPTANKQNVTLHYVAVLDGTIDNYTFSTKNMEENEVANIAWLKVSNEELNKYPWAFNHKDIITRMLYKVITNNAQDCSYE